MLTDKIKPFMQDAVTEVLETMCFISVEQLGDDTIADPEELWLAGELDFIGQPSGSFGISVPPATAAVMAANFLGEDEAGLDEKQIVEFVGEMTNMVCGALLSYLDPKAAFSLSPPRHAPSAIPDRTQANRVSASYRFDEGCIYAWLQVREQL